MGKISMLPMKALSKKAALLKPYEMLVMHADHPKKLLLYKQKRKSIDAPSVKRHGRRHKSMQLQKEQPALHMQLRRLRGPQLNHDAWRIESDDENEKRKNCAIQMSGSDG